ncbi:fatty acid alpha-hydroxylase [Gryganskiella cystojenkinii]|nr:fatty acid alpha-hydroxylase [Gryganskiella cystojenkinii]
MASEKVITLAEVAKHRKADDCWVIHNQKVYNVSGFVADHPGGEELILDHAGEDITAIMKDELEHLHSEGAYEMLDELLVGRLEFTKGSVSTSGSSTTVSAVGEEEKDPSKMTTDIQADKKEKFLDLSQPLLYQLWKANYPKDFYMKQIHIPRHLPYSARVFESDFLEVFSRTPWWLVPVLWLPVVALIFSWSVRGTPETTGALSMEKAGSTFVTGVFVWSLTEYSIHRFLFHVDDLLPDSTYSNVAHFLLHGIHHYLPMDRLRLVMPPVLTILIGFPLYCLAHGLFESHYANALMSGTYFGYICYDMVHYALHHSALKVQHLKEMKSYHFKHHYKQADLGYGITSKIWDRVFGTLLEM